VSVGEGSRQRELVPTRGKREEEEKVLSRSRSKYILFDDRARLWCITIVLKADHECARLLPTNSPLSVAGVRQGRAAVVTLTMASSRGL